jgi:hypothetical protein
MIKRSHVSTLLTCIGAIGVVATSIMAVKATPKATRLLEVSEEEKGEKLTKMEMVKIAGPAYIPAAVVGVSTIACIFGANILTKNSQASLASAYALLDRSYKEYRNKVNALYGEEADDEVRTKLATDYYEDCDESDIETDIDLNDDDMKLFFDFNTLQMFRAPMSKVINKTIMDGGTECYIITSPIEPVIDSFY